VMYALVFGKIGMGTKEPAARVHIHDDETSADYLFAPDKSGVPEFRISRGGEATQQLSLSITENKAKLFTDKDGFLFQLQLNAADTAQSTAEQAKIQVIDSQVFMTALNGSPAIGVGTVSPAGGLDLRNRTESSLLLNPGNGAIPEIIWQHAAIRKSLSVQVNDNGAQFITNAPEGFSFGRGEYSEGEPETIVTIKPDHKVGIGTTEPDAHLDITDKSSGRFVMSLKNANPALGIINLRPEEGLLENYFTLGANNDHAILISDCSEGFVFKRGYESGDDNAVNIDQGVNLMKITSKGKVGIGEASEPVNYNLDVFGSARMLTMYLDTDVDKLRNVKEIGDNILRKVKELRPVKFNWKGKYLDDPGDQKQLEKEHFGFLPHEVQEYFPQLVKSHNGIKSLAYGNMTAVLVKAIQELTDRIEALEQKPKRS
jgi:hypothetical protein